MFDFKNKLHVRATESYYSIFASEECMDGVRE